jgi:dephospho-CoA kinase
MRCYGLTGGIGMGKSTCARLLAERGVAAIDTDALARDLVEPGQPALQEISATFGSHLIDATGQLRRDALADLVFRDAGARHRLEAILHPRILKAWQEQVTQWRVEGRTLGVVVIPLLFETGAEAHFDATVCVACTAATQRARLRDRGWSQVEIQRRSAAQLPVEQKVSRSRFVIWSEGELAVHEAQIWRIFGSFAG